MIAVYVMFDVKRHYILCIYFYFLLVISPFLQNERVIIGSLQEGCVQIFRFIGSVIGWLDSKGGQFAEMRLSRADSL